MFVYTCMNPNPVFGLISFQSFGFMEGKPVQDLRDMAKAAGQSMPGFTPPQGETQEQVGEVLKPLHNFFFFFLWAFIYLFIL